MTGVTVTAGVTGIDREAFQHCDHLASVTIPASVKNNKWCAFKYCGDFTIYAPAGSYAIKYAQSNHIPYVEK